MRPANDNSKFKDDPARRERVRDVEQWLNDPKVQRRVADLIGGRKSGGESGPGADGKSGA